MLSFKMVLPALLYNLTLLSFFMAIVLSVFFLATRNGRKSGNIVIAMLLFLFSFQIFYSFSISDPAYIYFMDWHKPLFLLRQTALLTGPLIYFYALTFLKKLEFRPVQLLHVIPFSGMILFLILYNSGSGDFVIWLSPLDLYTTILILAINFTYIVMACIELQTFRFSVTLWFNNLKKSSYISWIQYILFSFIVLWILNLNISAIWMITHKPEWCAYSRSIYTLTVFIFLGSILFILMLQPAIYYLPGKYKNAPVDDETKARYKKVLSDYMELMKPYINPDVTLEKVARDISVNVRTLSQIINESFNNNFNGYINEFRIKESLKQLSDHRNKKTILEILYDSGFNSKSAFYSEFKKYTAITPQEYRNKNKMEQKESSS
jgi:AraC-like DNA-binding protein